MKKETIRGLIRYKQSEDKSDTTIVINTEELLKTLKSTSASMLYIHNDKDTTFFYRETNEDLDDFWSD